MQPAPAAQPAPAPTPVASGVPLSLLDAVRTTLQKHPAISSAYASLRERDAELRLSQGSFDPLLTSSLGHTREVEPLLPGKLRSDTTELSLGAAKRFQVGTQLLPSVSLQRLHQRREPNMLGLPSAATQRAQLDLTVVQPLLRGAGTTGAASEVRAARQSLRAAEHDASHTAQLRVFETLAAYFVLVAADQELALLAASRQRAQTMVDETRVLVEHDQRPRGDLRQLEGNLATRERTLLEAQSAREQALYDLRLAMGLPPDVGAAYRPTDGYPAGAPQAGAPGALEDDALAMRQDVQAADEIVRAAGALLDGAEHNSMPQLDLALSVGYVGALDDDGVGPFFASPVRNVPGVNAGATLSLELPLGNVERQAARDLAGARSASATILRDDLKRNVRTDVARALAALRMSEAALIAARSAEASYAQALSDERDKLRAGLSTVIDVVLTEELATQAQLGRVRNELGRALSLCRLRFALGALPAGEADLAGGTDALWSRRVPRAGR